MTSPFPGAVLVRYHANYTCQITYEGNDSWRLRSLDME